MPAAQSPRAEPSPVASPRYRVLSLDGGGIYGLVTATWLRKIAEKQPRFLAEPTRKPGMEAPRPGEELSILAGASSGAVNALLLARHDSPRDALLSGEIEGFWKKAGVFSNSDPMASWLSFLGVGAWFGTDDLKGVLDEYFKDLRLKDLRHNVLIACFDWYGHDRKDFIDLSARPSAFPWMNGAQVDWSALFKLAAKPQDKRSWRPRSFTNFLPHGTPKDWDYRVADLAYAACAAAGFRAIIGGLGDAASFTVNPAMEAITAFTYLERWWGRRSPTPTTLMGIQTQLTDASYDHDALLASGHFLRDHQEEDELAGAATGPLGVLDEIGILSLGDGTLEPGFFLESFNLSTSQVQAFPTHPGTGNFFSPQTWLALDAPTRNIDDYTRIMIGPHRYMRLNPPVLSLPTLVASGIARFPWYRHWILEQLIPAAVASEPSTRALDWATRYLEQHWWLTNEQATAMLE